MSDIQAQARRDAEFDRLLAELYHDVPFVGRLYTEDALRDAYEMGKRHGVEHALEVSEKWAPYAKVKP